VNHATADRPVGKPDGDRPEEQCWDGNVLCRLTPITDEQRQLGAFLARLIADRRLPHLRRLLTEPVESLFLPDRSTPPPRPALRLEIG